MTKKAATSREPRKILEVTSKMEPGSLLDVSEEEYKALMEHQAASAKALPPARYWDELSKTPPEHTKPYRGEGGFSGTEYKPVHAYERLTRLFGPVGFGWGWEVLDEDMYEGASFVIDSTLMFERIHTCKIQVWITEEGEKTLLPPQYGCTKAVAYRATNPKYNRPARMESIVDAKKMSVTDGVSKSFQALGMIADILKGELDAPQQQRQPPAPRRPAGPAGRPPGGHQGPPAGHPAAGFGTTPPATTQGPQGPSTGYRPDPLAETVQAILPNVIAAWAKIGEAAQAQLGQYGPDTRRISPKQKGLLIGRSRAGGISDENLRSWIYEYCDIDYTLEMPGVDDHLQLIPSSVFGALLAMVDAGAFPETKVQS